MEETEGDEGQAAHCTEDGRDHVGRGLGSRKADTIENSDNECEEQ